MNDLNEMAQSIYSKDLLKSTNDELVALAVMFSTAICEEMHTLSISTILSGAYKMQDDTLGSMLFRRTEEAPFVVYCSVDRLIISQRSAPMNHNIIDGVIWALNPLREDVIAFLYDASIITKALKTHENVGEWVKKYHQDLSLRVLKKEQKEALDNLSERIAEMNYKLSDIQDTLTEAQDEFDGIHHKIGILTNLMTKEIDNEKQT